LSRIHTGVTGSRHGKANEAFPMPRCRVVPLNGFNGIITDALFV